MTRRPAFLILVGLCLLGVNCGPSTVWEEKVASPSGSWIATAKTEQNGGPGNDWIITEVFLEYANMAETRREVLAFSCEGAVPHPYTLDNKANAGGTIDLTMKWLTPTHLEVTFNGSAGGTLEFQAVKYHEIDISVRDVSSKEINSSP